MMTKSRPLTRALMSICGGCLIAITLAGCTTAENDYETDRQRCSDARHNSGCMYMRQHRRDREQLINQERALINAEQARENLRMLREIRRKRGEY